MKNQKIKGCLGDCVEGVCLVRRSEKANYYPDFENVTFNYRPPLASYREDQLKMQ